MQDGLVRSIGPHIDILSGFAFNSGLFSDESGMPLIRIRDLLVQKTETYFTGPYDSKYIVHDDDVLIGMDGDFNIVRWQGGKGLLNQRVCKVLCISTSLDAGYLFHWLPIKLLEIHQRTPQTTVRHLSPEAISRIAIPFFPLPEQHRIADILDTVDAAIEETEALIVKLKLMKAGLLHDLLTRGLDEQGHLRDPSAHPEQFKDSPLGRIPRGWEIALLGNMIFRGGGFIQTGPFGSQLHAHEYTQEGVPVIMPQDVQDDGISEQQIARISLAKANVLTRHRVEQNDVIFARRGDLSRCAAIRSSEVGWLCGTGCLLLRPGGAEVDSRWLAAMYRHDHSQRQILARAVGSTMVNLNTSLLATLIIAKPAYAEQRVIAETMEAHDARLRAEEAYCDKLKQLKKGLMRNLLTGRVRVQAVEAAQ